MTHWAKKPAPILLQHMLNPIRSEQEAFRFLIYVLIVAGALVAIVLLIRTIT